MSSGQTTTMQPVAGKTIALTVLALGTFAIGTDGHIVIGLLDQIAAGLGVSDPRAGQLVTVFALCYALFAPICGWLFGGLDRKKAIRIAAWFSSSVTLFAGLRRAIGRWSWVASLLRSAQPCLWRLLSP
jgi:predicted MFS family arabinose efflux permease